MSFLKIFLVNKKWVLCRVVFFVNDFKVFGVFLEFFFDCEFFCILCILYLVFLVFWILFGCGLKVIFFFKKFEEIIVFFFVKLDENELLSNLSGF